MTPDELETALTCDSDPVGTFFHGEQRLCRHCVHEDILWFGKHGLRVCRNPSAQISGHAVESHVARLPNYACGPDGLLYEDGWRFGKAWPAAVTLLTSTVVTVGVLCWFIWKVIT